MVKMATLLFLAGLFMAGCIDNHETVVLTGQEDFREGDLVLRCGYGAESRVVTEASRSIYSHIGILHRDAATRQWMVVHAVPGEAEQGQPEWLKAEPVAEFYAYERAVRGAWMRVDCADSVARQAAAYAMEKVAQKVEFDNDYLLADTSRLYCTELVWQAYRHQGIDLTGGRRSEVPTFFCTEGKCIFPCDIEASPEIRFIKTFETKSE